MSPSIFRSSLKVFRKDHGAQNPKNSTRKKHGGQHNGATTLSTVTTSPSKTVDREQSLAVQDISPPGQTSGIIAQIESQSTEQVLSPMAQATSAVQQPATTVPTSPPLAPTTSAASCADSIHSNTVPSDASSIAQGLWDRAYDDLKADEPALVLAYEKILSRELNEKALKSGELEFQTNTIEQLDPAVRRLQMGLLVQAGLKKTESVVKVKQGIGGGLDVILAAKDIVCLAVQTVPQAALAWTGVCFALQVLQNPTAETKANREGIVHVISRMHWYWNMSSLLLKENMVDGGSSTRLRHELEKRIVDLYKVLLSYQIRSVCSYYRNQFLNLLRDIIKVDNWDGNLKSVQEAEKEVRQDSDAYNTQQIRSHLEQLVNNAKNQQTKLLQNIYQAIQEQLDRGANAELAYYSGPDSPLNRLPYAENAPFNSFGTQHVPACLPDTRVDILQEVFAWADSLDERCIFWLNGLAGTGKSTIARTVARRYHDQERLGASFFFSRGGGDVSHAGKFVTSIAVQLAKKSSFLLRYVSEAITKQGNIASQSLRDQWQQLILGPLSKLHDTSCPPSYILVVDALDECDDDSSIRTVLQLLAEARSLTTVRLRIFITSRPEIPIRHGFYQIREAEHQDFVLHSISPPIVDHDITIFLEYNLRLIREEFSLDPSWPSEEEIRRLVRRASGLFIWAATACRFIRGGRKFAADRLSEILKDEPSIDDCSTDDSGTEESSVDSSTIAPEEQLNKIYITVLNNSVRSYKRKERKKWYELLKETAGTIVLLLSPLSAFSLAGLLRVCGEDIIQTLDELHSILDIPEDRHRQIRLHHPSFRDFLLSKDRCGNSKLWVDEKQGHRTLAGSCIRLMSTTLKQDICGLSDPGALVTNVESSRVTERLTPDVQYACLYWIQHLQKGCVSLDDHSHHIYAFLKEHLLHWLEALGWMGKTSEGVLTLSFLESYISADKNPNLHAFVHDAKRFVLYNRPVIELAPLQTYCSALLFAPEQSIVRKQFENRIPSWICRKPRVEAKWNAILQTLEGHSDYVRSVAFSPDGKLVASGSYDETVRLWDAGTGAQLQKLEGHSDYVMSVAFSADGKVVASGSYDEIVRLWDAGTGAQLQKCKGHSRGITSVAFSADGKLVVSGSYDRTVRLWDAGTGAQLQKLRGHSDVVRSVAFSPDGKLLASGSDDKTVRFWDAGTGAQLQKLEGHWYDVMSVAFSPDGKVVASGSVDETVRLWDAGTGAQLQKLEGHSDYVTSVSFSPDGKLLASGSGDKTVRLWDAGTGVQLQKLEGHSQHVMSVAFSPNGKLVASGSDDKTVRLWDTGTGAQLQRLDGHSVDVTSVAFSPDGKLLASGSGDRTVRLWDASTGAQLQKLEGHSDFVTSVAFSPDGKLVASGSYDETVRLWDAGTGSQLQELEGHSRGVTSVAFSPGGKLLASGSYDRTVGLWDASTGAQLQKLEGHSDFVTSVAFSPDGKLVASGSYDKTVRLWDAGTGAQLQKLEGHSRYVMSVAFSADGKLVASGSDDKTVRLWDAGSGAQLQTLHLDIIARTLSFSTSGQYLETDRGVLNASSIESLTDSAEQVRLIFVSDNWVTEDGQSILWLPPDYRATCVAICNAIVVLGHSSGGMSFLEFEKGLKTVSLK